MFHWRFSRDTGCSLWGLVFQPLIATNTSQSPSPEAARTNKHRLMLPSQKKNSLLPSPSFSVEGYFFPATYLHSTLYQVMLLFHKFIVKLRMQACVRTWRSKKPNELVLIKRHIYDKIITHQRRCSGDPYYLKREQVLSRLILNTPSSLTLFLCTVPPKTLFIICKANTQTHTHKAELILGHKDHILVWFQRCYSCLLLGEMCQRMDGCWFQFPD